MASNSEPRQMEIDQEGNIIVTGSFSDSMDINYGIGNNYVYSNGYRDGYIKNLIQKEIYYGIFNWLALLPISLTLYLQMILTMYFMQEYSAIQLTLIQGLALTYIFLNIRTLHTSVRLIKMVTTYGVKFLVMNTVEWEFRIFSLMIMGSSIYLAALATLAILTSVPENIK